MIMRKTIKWLAAIVGIGVAILCVVAACYLVVMGNARGRTYDDVAEIPHNKVGLLLATSPFTAGGARNFYFENRIKAADELYKAGKVDFIIASGGDYRHSEFHGYDVPQAILDSLVACGIPKERIILDYGW